MGKNKQYDQEYKVQAVKLAKEIGQAKAAEELGIPRNTMYGWIRANRLGNLDLGAGSQTPQSAMTLNEEVIKLRQQVKKLDKGGPAIIKSISPFTPDISRILSGVRSIASSLYTQTCGKFSFIVFV